MIPVQLQNFLETTGGRNHFIKSQMPQTDQVDAMDAIPQFDVLIKDQHVREGNGKIVDGDGIIPMQLAKFNKAFKDAAGLFRLTQLNPGQRLINYLVRLWVIVVYRLRRLADADRRGTEFLNRLCGLPQSFIYTT